MASGIQVPLPYNFSAPEGEQNSLFTIKGVRVMATVKKWIMFDRTRVESETARYS